MKKKVKQDCSSFVASFMDAERRRLMEENRQLLNYNKILLE